MCINSSGTWKIPFWGFSNFLASLLRYCISSWRFAELFHEMYRGEMVMKDSLGFMCCSVLNIWAHLSWYQRWQRRFQIFRKKAFFSMISLLPLRQTHGEFLGASFPCAYGLAHLMHVPSQQPLRVSPPSVRFCFFILRVSETWGHGYVWIELQMNMFCAKIMEFQAFVMFLCDNLG